MYWIILVGHLLDVGGYILLAIAAVLFVRIGWSINSKEAPSGTQYTPLSPWCPFISSNLRVCLILMMISYYIRWWSYHWISQRVNIYTLLKIDFPTGIWYIYKCLNHTKKLQRFIMALYFLGVIQTLSSITQLNWAHQITQTRKILSKPLEVLPLLLIPLLIFNFLAILSSLPSEDFAGVIFW